MIGNDIVDLALAKKESNWKRARYLDKIFTVHEQNLIHLAENQDVIIWNLWSRKEAAYKIFNRQTRIRAFNPTQFECIYTNENCGQVQYKNEIYYTKTTIDNDQIHTIATVEALYFDKINFIKDDYLIYKRDGFPYVQNSTTTDENIVSKSHHGRFSACIALVLF